MSKTSPCKESMLFRVNNKLLTVQMPEFTISTFSGWGKGMLPRMTTVLPGGRKGKFFT